ncbi:MAG: sugar phosphate isomerase/epimerase family protein [Candidatus Cyclobacteriaceae bacterium M3_2C_046]
MNLGLGTYSLAWSIGVSGYETPEKLNALDVVRLASEYGLGVVQIADNIPLHKFDPSQLEALKLAAEKAKIKLEIGARGMNQENLIKHIKLAHYFSSDLLRVVIDAPGYRPNLPEIIAIIKDYVPILKEKKVQLAIENHDRLKAAEFVQILHAVDSDQVGICLDTVNSFGRGEGLETVINALAPFTINLHIKDFSIQRLSHNMGFHITGTPAGQGMLPIEDLVKKLGEYGRCQSGIVELWPEPEDNVKKTQQKELDWLRQSIQYLKNYFE